MYVCTYAIMFPQIMSKSPQVNKILVVSIDAYQVSKSYIALNPSDFVKFSFAVFGL